jgi:RNA polymerase sigma factor (sigma-70 family)
MMERSQTKPEELVELQILSATNPDAAEAAWERLLERHSRLLLKVAHAAGGGYDDALDRYSYMIERLREDQFRRLRHYTPDANCRFSTWLVVVAQRLVADHQRIRYGRFRSPTGVAAAETRRALADWQVLGHLEERVAAPDDLSDDLDREERTDAVRATVMSLAPEDRLLLRLRHDDELPVREIIRLLGFPTVFHVYRRLDALYRTLRRALLDQGIGRE